jgi:hypothetical protein
MLDWEAAPFLFLVMVVFGGVIGYGIIWPLQRMGVDTQALGQRMGRWCLRKQDLIMLASMFGYPALLYLIVWAAR